MKLKTDLKRIKWLAKHLGKILDEKNTKICSDCKQARTHNECGKDTDILTVEEARSRGRIESKEAGCCSRCMDYYWNNTYDEGRHKQLRKLKRLYGYDEYYHFFDTEKKCCKLPRHKRSSICLSWGLGCLFGQDYDKKDRIIKIVRTIENIKYRHGILF